MQQKILEFTNILRKGGIRVSTAEAIDAAVRKIINDAFERAVATLEQHRAVLDEGAALLLSKETLNEADLESLKGELPIVAARPWNEPGT